MFGGPIAFAHGSMELRDRLVQGAPRAVNDGLEVEHLIALPLDGGW